MGVGTAIAGAAVVGAGASIYSGKRQADAMQNAANAQAAAAERAQQLAIQAAQTKRAEDIALAQDAAAYAEQVTRQANAVIDQAIAAGVDTSNAEFQTAYNQIKSGMQPYIQQGQQADQRLNALTFGTPEEVQNAMTLDPGYQFRLNQGTQALDRQGVIGAGRFNPRTALAIQDFGQQSASSEFQNMYNRLLGLSQRGYGAVTNVGNAGWTNAGMRSNNAMTLANTRAQNALNLSNTQVQGRNNIVNAGMQGNAGVQSAVQQGAWNTAAAQQNAANMNAQGQILQSNVLPQVANNAMNTGMTWYGYNQQNQFQQDYLNAIRGNRSTYTPSTYGMGYGNGSIIQPWEPGAIQGGMGMSPYE